MHNKQAGSVIEKCHQTPMCISIQITNFLKSCSVAPTLGNSWSPCHKTPNHTCMSSMSCLTLPYKRRNEQVSLATVTVKQKRIHACNELFGRCRILDKNWAHSSVCSYICRCRWNINNCEKIHETGSVLFRFISFGYVRESITVHPSVHMYMSTFQLYGRFHVCSVLSVF